MNTITVGDARILGKSIPDGSIDLVFTDPPYHKEYLYLYEWLSGFAARVLKPGGFLLTYAGNYWKDKVMGHLGEHLEYFYDYVLPMSNSTMLWPRKTIARAKSILAYTHPDSKAKPKTNVLGLFDGGKRDKRYHDWGQDQESARYFIECFSSVGDTVCDPFVGGGTTSAVCKRIMRNCIAFEIDPSTAEIARQRVAGGGDVSITDGLPLFASQCIK